MSNAIIRFLEIRDAFTCHDEICQSSNTALIAGLSQECAAQYGTSITSLTMLIIEELVVLLTPLYAITTQHHFARLNSSKLMCSASLKHASVFNRSWLKS